MKQPNQIAIGYIDQYLWGVHANTLDEAQRYLEWTAEANWKPCKTKRTIKVRIEAACYVSNGNI